MKTILLVITLLFSMFFSYAQQPGVKWEINNEFLAPQAFYPTGDGGFIGSQNSIFRIDNQGLLK